MSAPSSSPIVIRRKRQSLASIMTDGLSMCIILSAMLLLFPTSSAFAPPSLISPSATLRSNDALHSTNTETDAETADAKQPHIVILGGGFGGINTALTLPTLPWSDTALQPKITLIDKSERFVFLPLLYELCVEDASLDEVAPTFQSLLEDRGSAFSALASGGLPDLGRALQPFSGEGGGDAAEGDGCDLSFLRAQVEGIDARHQQVIVSKSSADGDSVETIDYDALIIATGSEISLDAIPGASDFALPFYTVEQALELKRRLALLDGHLEEGGEAGGQRAPVNVVVVGGGYSGVELALNLVDRFGGSGDATGGSVRVSLVHRGEEVLEYATEHNRNAGADRLKSAGVNVMTSTSVVEVLPAANGSDGITGVPTLSKQQCNLKLSTKSESNDGTAEERILPTTLLLWTAGATPASGENTGIRNSVLPRDAMGRILTSRTLNVPRYPSVFAVGDCSRPKKEQYPGTAQVAIQMATVAAWNAFATLAYGSSSSNAQGSTSKLLPFKFLNLGEMMTLGSDDATISTLGGKVELSGPAASWLRRWVYAIRMPTTKAAGRSLVNGTGRKLARGAAVGSGKRRKSKPVDWK